MKTRFYQYFLIATGNNRMQEERAGFTIVELLVVLCTTVILLAGILALYSWHSTMFMYQQAVVRTSDSGRVSMQELHTYVAQSHRILSSVTLGGTVYTTGPSTMALQIPAIDSNGAALDGKWDYAVFYASGTNFYKLLSPDASSARVGGKKLLSDCAASLIFTYDNADVAQAKKITVDLTTSLQAKNQTVNNTLEQNLYLKNY